MLRIHAVHTDSSRLYVTCIWYNNDCYFKMLYVVNARGTVLGYTFRNKFSIHMLQANNNTTIQANIRVHIIRKQYIVLYVNNGSLLPVHVFFCFF
jgi:hypothetical protein